MQGLIRSDGSGLATFRVRYDCVCMRLWPEEVVDAVVEQVTSYGIRVSVGPFHIFVSEKVLSRSARPEQHLCVPGVMLRLQSRSSLRHLLSVLNGNGRSKHVDGVQLCS